MNLDKNCMYNAFEIYESYLLMIYFKIKQNIEQRKIILLLIISVQNKFEKLKTKIQDYIVTNKNNKLFSVLYC